MAWTIFYYGKLKDKISVGEVCDFITDFAERNFDAQISRDDFGIFLDFDKGTSETLCFVFSDKKIDAFCKWNGEDEAEFYKIFDLFIELRPFFKYLHITDDFDEWTQYNMRNQPCKIILREINSDIEKQLLLRMERNMLIPLSMFEIKFLSYRGRFPSNIKLYRIVMQDFVKIMDYKLLADFNEQILIDYFKNLNFSKNLDDFFARIRLDIFRFRFLDMMMFIWLNYAFTYKNLGLVADIEKISRDLNSSVCAAMSGLPPIFMNGPISVEGAKHVEMAKLAAKYYPAKDFDEADINDEPETELKFFVSMMDFLGLKYIGTDHGKGLKLNNI
ncbi:MAG: hypothetical protein FWF08_00190 [Oscillospiraceae bacterium]|nr:hypothetical protein [Oscillospiraceae bacterium]